MGERRIGQENSAVLLAIPLLAAVAIVMILLKSAALTPVVIEAVADRLSVARGFDSRIVSLNSIKEAESALGTDVWLPVYFPEYLMWPPSNVGIQRYPEKSVTLTFRFSDQREALVLKQFLTTGVNREGIIPQPVSVSRRSVVNVGSGNAMLVEGFDNLGNPRSVLYWAAQGRFIMMAGELPASELVRMAHSLRSIGHTPSP